MLKRLFDIFAASIALLSLSPLLLLIGMWVKLDSPGPVLFKQSRVGRFGREFKALKFRSMHSNSTGDGPQITVASDARITRAGRLLRKYKLDELPQLICVVIGDMSIVGPRPEVPKYVAHYPADVREIVLSIRPGITDLASIEYRDENSLLEQSNDPERMYIEVILPAKLEYYVAYVENRSMLLDLRIILRTLHKIAMEQT